MSATAILETTDLTEAPKDCQILILCEDFAAYERAVETCRRVMDRFAGEVDFHFKCWDFIELADADCARSATKTASSADIILLTMHGMDLPPVLDEWLATIPAIRFRAEGALVLIGDEAGSRAASGKLLARLEQLAGRVGMDFLPFAPVPVESTRHAFQEDDWLVAATQAENRQHPQFDHWGLNE